MPPKSKKVKAKTKSKAKSKASHGLSQNNVASIMLCIQIEDTIQRLNWAKMEIAQLKTDCRASKMKNTQTIHSIAEKVKSKVEILETAESKSEQAIFTAKAYQNELKLHEEYYRQAFIRDQQRSEAKINFLKEQITGLNEKIDSVNDFEKTPWSERENLVNALLSELDDAKARHKREIDKLVHRHEVNVQNIERRMNGHIGTMEEKSCLKALDGYKNLEHEADNKNLKKRLQEMKVDYARIESEVRDLESKHSALISDIIEVDYNLNFQDETEVKVPTNELTPKSAVSMAKAKQLKYDPLCIDGTAIQMGTHIHGAQIYYSPVVDKIEFPQNITKMTRPKLKK